MVNCSPQSSKKPNDDGHGEEINDSPIEEVRLTVPTTDDPSLPVLTFRTWSLGLASCLLLSFVNNFYGYRQNQVGIASSTVQILALPLGKLMATTLPSRPIKVPFTSWSFSMNPGPFNMKEHVLITIFANTGASGSYSTHIITSVKAYYHRSINVGAAFLLCTSTQIFGYGWAGLFRKVLVDSPYMWWPATLVQVSFFSALHEKEKRVRKGLTRLQFFLIAFVSSFAYYIIPGYLFPSISGISVLCLIWKNSVTIQQIGSGYHGLGLGAFSFDWAVISGGDSPLAYPASALLNSLVGFVAVIYVALPILYYNDVYHARRFPMISPNTFDSQGQIYNISRILNEKTFDLNIDAYDSYSTLYLSITYAFNSIGLGFATFAATFSHVVLFYGRDIWQMWRDAGDGMKNRLQDVHTRLMKQNYDVVPQWWFCIILILSLGLSLWACEGFGKQIQLPWWGILLACFISVTLTLPIGVIQATTNSQLGLHLITQMVMGYLYPGRPLANMAFKTYAYISMFQTLTFISDFKLGHYMKVPPKSMFIVQLVGAMVASSSAFGICWWLLTTIDHICDVSLLPEGSPWTCLGEDSYFNQSIIWGVVGPMRMFGKLGNYPSILTWCILLGLFSPVVVWGLMKIFPEKKWLGHINVPLILGSATSIPPDRTVRNNSWYVVGIFFNTYVYKKYKGWWARYNYILSIGMDTGMVFVGLFLYIGLQYKDIYGPDWWGLSVGDHCPLATCPTAPGINVEGCPVF